MRITQLQLKAFRSYVNLDLPLDAPRIFVCGTNETGKSTVREALKYILTGRCQGLDARGSGADLLVPTFDGANGVSASAVIDGIGAVERTWSGSGSSLRVQGWTGTAQTQQAALYDKLQTTEAFLDAVLDSSVFLNLHHAEAKALVLALLNVRIQIGDGDHASVMTLAELDEAYREAFEDRKVAKKVLQGITLPPKPLDEPLPKLADVDALLAKRREELGGLQRQLGETAGQKSALLAQQKRLEADATIAEKLALSDVSDQITTLEERLAIMEADASEAVTTVTKRPPAKTSGVSVGELERRIETLRTFQPSKGCIIDGKVKCHTQPLLFKNRAKDLQAEIEARDAEEHVPDPPATVNPLTDIRHQIDVLKKQQVDFVRVEEGKAQRTADLAKIAAALGELPDTTDIEKAVAEWQSKITKGEGIRKTVIASEQAHAAFETALQQQKDAKSEVDRLEQMCAVLGPTGVRVQALANALGSFEEAVTVFTAPFGLTVKFSLDPWDVIVNDRPVRTYSKSQQYRIGIAIQLAVAGLSGLRFAVVDELDMLDQAKRDTLMRTLFRDAPVDQLIVLATREPAQPLPKIPGLVGYRLDLHEGRSVVVERSAA